MNKRILTLFMTLVMLITSISVVSAENTEASTTAETPVELWIQANLKHSMQWAF